MNYNDCLFEEILRLENEIIRYNALINHHGKYLDVREYFFSKHDEANKECTLLYNYMISVGLGDEYMNYKTIQFLQEPGVYFE